jgi:hypothetical protein
LPSTIGGDADSPVLSPDGARVVSRVDLRHEGSFELFSAPVDGSVSPINLSRQLVVAGSVQAGYVFSAATGTSASPSRTWRRSTVPSSRPAR